MTVKELSKLYHLNREIEVNQRQLARLEADIQADAARLAELRSSIDGLASPKTDSLPHGTDVHSKVESTAIQIVSLEEGIRKKHSMEINIQASITTRQTLCLLERERLEKYIDGIPDPLLRIIFTLRFVNGLPWSQVALEAGGSYQEEVVKKMCYRYLAQTRKSDNVPKGNNVKQIKGELAYVEKYKEAYKGNKKTRFPKH